MLVVWLLLLILLLWVYRRREIYKMGIRLNSGLWAFPFLGHSYLHIGNNEAQMEGYKTLGRDAIRNDNGMTSFWLGCKLLTVIADAVAAEFIFKTVLEKDDVMLNTKFYLGNGSIFAPVTIWKPRRKVLAPTFGTKNIKQFISIFTKNSSILSRRLHEVAGTGIISMWQYLTGYTMDSITEAVLGYETHAQSNSEHPLLESMEVSFKTMADRLSKPWLHSDAIYFKLPVYKELLSRRQYTWDFIKELLVAKRKEISEKSSKSNGHRDSQNTYTTFLEMLIDKSGGDHGYTDLEITEELVVLLMAGNDTTASAAGFTLLMLSRYPEVQSKVADELQEVFGDSDKPATVEDLSHLKYLTAVVKETLRLYTPVPIIARKVDEEIILPCDFKMVPGTGVILHLWALHRNPRYWGDDAEEFRPERFIDRTLKHPAAFVPFSFGPRDCTGYKFAMMSIQTVLSTILRQFKILPPNDLPISLQPPIRLEFNVMMKDVDNFQIRLERRFNNIYNSKINNGLNN